MDGQWLHEIGSLLGRQVNVFYRKVELVLAADGRPEETFQAFGALICWHMFGSMFRENISSAMPFAESHCVMRFSQTSYTMAM